jgi:hypothetical protein
VRRGRERRIVRDIVVNRFWEFPDDKAAIGCDTGQSITVYCHINDTGIGGKDGGKLKEGAIATRSGDDADAS